MAARSSGMFPKYATWVDSATILPANGDLLAVPPLNHSGEVHFVAYFDEAAVGSVDVVLSSGYTLTFAADPGKKVVAVRSGYELGDMGGTPTANRVNTSLTAGSCQISIF